MNDNTSFSPTGRSPLARRLGAAASKRRVAFASLMALSMLVGACDSDEFEEEVQQRSNDYENDPSTGETQWRDCDEDYETCWEPSTLDWVNGWSDAGLTPITDATLYRVRRCIDPDDDYNCIHSSTGEISDPMFDMWPTAGVTTDKQNDTYIAVTGQTDPGQVKHLVFMAAGQQGGGGNEGQVGCGQTGQNTSYKDDFRADVTLGSKAITLKTWSLAYQVFNTNVPGTADRFRDPNETFMALAFDHRLNYNVVAGNEDVIDAFYEYLRSRVDMGQLESITFAGHSRGGTLVTKLAQRFAHDEPDLKIVLQIYEGVSEKKELYADPDTGEEPGRYDTKIINPRRPSGKNWKGRLVRWERAFNRPTAPTDIRVLNLTGGRLAAGLMRPVSGEPPTASSTAWTMSHEGQEFYEQCWLLTDHMQTSYDYVGAPPSSSSSGSRGIRHLLAASYDLGAL